MMGIELTIGNELAGMTVDLGEFATVIKNLAGEAKEKEVKSALKEMIAEVRRSFDTVADVFAPLYELDTQRKFDEGFSKLRASFKATYLKETGEFRTHCHIVAIKLDELKQKRAWLEKLPFARRSFQRLEDLAGRWLLSDYTLADEMDTFLRNMNEFLDAVANPEKLSRSDAFRYLVSSVAQFEDYILVIKRRLDGLTMISAEL